MFARLPPSSSELTERKGVVPPSPPADRRREHREAADSSSLGDLTQPPDKGIAAGNDIISGAELVVCVGLAWVTRPEVHRGDTHCAEARDISPTELCGCLTTNRAEKLCRRW